MGCECTPSAPPSPAVHNGVSGEAGGFDGRVVVNAVLEEAVHSQLAMFVARTPGDALPAPPLLTAAVYERMVRLEAEAAALRSEASELRADLTAMAEEHNEVLAQLFDTRAQSGAGTDSAGEQRGKRRQPSPAADEEELVREPRIVKERRAESCDTGATLPAQRCASARTEVARDAS